MESMRRWMISGAICLSGVSAMCLMGCVVHPRHEDWVDDRGYHHVGFYDEGHAWHGGYDDERGMHHDDPADWHH